LPVTGRGELEDPNDHGRLDRVDPVFHVRSRTGGADDRHVVVAETLAAADIPGTRQRASLVVRALTRLVTLHLVRHRLQLEHDLLDGGVEREFAVLEVAEHAHAGLDQLLQHEADLDLLAADATLVHDDQHVDRRSWFACGHGHQSHERRTARELGPADAVIDVDVRVVDGPALAPRILTCVGHLARH